MLRVKSSVELSNAIGRSDRKLTRKLMLEGGIRFASVSKRNLKICLRDAVQSRDALLVRKLLELMPGLSPLYAARMLWIVAEDGDTEIATMLVLAGADVNMRSSPHTPNLLHVLAASPKKLDLAVLMMEHGADLTSTGINGCTALTCAIQRENFKLAKELLRRNCPVEESDVQAAVDSAKTVEWMKMFVNDYPDIETSRGERIADLFSWFCQNDVGEEKVSQCLDALLEMEVPDVRVIYDAVLTGKILLAKIVLNSSWVHESTKMMLLHPAVTLPNTAITELLIDRGGRLDHRLEFNVGNFLAGAQPIHAACATESVENIELLLRQGVDISVCDEVGVTPLSAMLLARDENVSTLTAASKLVIKHLALSVMQGSELEDADRLIIYKYQNFLEFYEDCLTEVRDMKTLKVLNRFVVYSIFTTDVKELSLLTKRREFPKYCDRDLLKLVFPLYFDELNFRIRAAEAHRDRLLQTENALYERLGKMLPDLVIDKIMVYVLHSNIHSKVL